MTINEKRIKKGSVEIKMQAPYISKGLNHLFKPYI
jgi:hypothetical protein